MIRKEQHGGEFNIADQLLSHDQSMNPCWALLTDQKKKAIPHDFENGSKLSLTHFEALNPKQF
jgi:hypothetical protein